MKLYTLKELFRLPRCRGWDYSKAIIFAGDGVSARRIATCDEIIPEERVWILSHLLDHDCRRKARLWAIQEAKQAITRFWFPRFPQDKKISYRLLNLATACALGSTSLEEVRALRDEAFKVVSTGDIPGSFNAVCAADAAADFRPYTESRCRIAGQIASSIAYDVATYSVRAAKCVAQSKTLLEVKESDMVDEHMRQIESLLKELERS
jgi:hypothetical protein